jgi:glycosyltransferase 2 family protein
MLFSVPLKKVVQKKMVLTDKPRFKKWIILSAVLGLLGFIAFIYYLLFFMDFTQIEDVIVGTNVSIYFLSFLCVIAASIVDALAWKSVLDSLSVKTTFRRIFSLSWVGHFVDALIPGGFSGDAFKTYILIKDKDVNGSKVVASTIIKDVLELLVVLGSLIVGIVLLVLNYSVNSLVMLVIGGSMVFLSVPLILVVYFSINVGAIERLLGILTRVYAKIRRKEHVSVPVTEKVLAQIKDFRVGIMSMKTNPKVMIKPLFFQGLTWVFQILSFYFVFIALRFDVGIDKIVITSTIITIFQGQGLALAGVAQIVSVELYSVLGITAHIAVASSLLAGFAAFWFALVLSFGFFQVNRARA